MAPQPEDRPLGSPYGPQPNGVDESAGGADSSPLENVPSDERPENAATDPDKEPDPDTPDYLLKKT